VLFFLEKGRGISAVREGSTQTGRRETRYAEKSLSWFKAELVDSEKY
jgi:hypothetical protein